MPAPNVHHDPQYLSPLLTQLLKRLSAEQNANIEYMFNSNLTTCSGKLFVDEQRAYETHSGHSGTENAHSNRRLIDARIDYDG